MATFAFTDRPTTEHDATGAVRRLVAGAVRYYRFRRALGILGEAEDHVLRDLGLARADVARVLRTGRR